MMPFKEFENKPATELQLLLKQLRQQLQELRFKVASKQLKNVREIRGVRKNIAQILMVLRRQRRPDDKPVIKVKTTAVDKI